MPAKETSRFHDTRDMAIDGYVREILHIVDETTGWRTSEIVTELERRKVPLPRLLPQDYHIVTHVFLHHLRKANVLRRHIIPERGICWYRHRVES